MGWDSMGMGMGVLIVVCLVFYWFSVGSLLALCWSLLVPGWVSICFSMSFLFGFLSLLNSLFGSIRSIRQS